VIFTWAKHFYIEVAGQSNSSAIRNTLPASEVVIDTYEPDGITTQSNRAVSFNFYNNTWYDSYGDGNWSWSGFYLLRPATMVNVNNNSDYKWFITNGNYNNLTYTDSFTSPTPPVIDITPIMLGQLNKLHLELSSVPATPDLNYPDFAINYKVYKDDNTTELFSYSFDDENHTFMYDFSKAGTYHVHVNYSIHAPFSLDGYSLHENDMTINVTGTDNVYIDNTGTLGVSVQEDCSVYNTLGQSGWFSGSIDLIGGFGCHFKNFGLTITDSVKFLFIPNSSEIANDFKNFNTNNFNLGEIIILPLTTIQSLATASCTPIDMALPNMDKTITLPCYGPIFAANFGAFWTIYQVILTGSIAYLVAINSIALAKHIKDPEDDKIEVFHL